jgi:hypothetical protein
MSQDASVLVACYQLGTIIREYRTRSFAQLVGRTWLALVSVLILGGLYFAGVMIAGWPVGLVVTGAWERIREEWLGWLYAIFLMFGDGIVVVSFLLLPLVMLLALIIKLVVHSWRIYICTDGFLVKKSRAGAFRWDQIVALQQQPQAYDIMRHGIAVFWRRPDTCDVIIKADDGRWLLLEPHLWRNFGELYALLDRQISARLLSRAIEALNAGESLDFGGIRVNQNGLSLLKRDGEVLDAALWKDIGDFKIKIRGGFWSSGEFSSGNRYCIVIEKRDQKRMRWYVPVLTNVSVLLAIKDSLLGKLQGPTDL